jgi:hypothetical protein
MLIRPIAFQAEVVGEAVGEGILGAIGTVLLVAAGLAGLILFLYLVRKLDRKINK